MNEINKRRLRYTGHALRSQKTDLMSTALMGRVEGCRKRGRPATSLMGRVEGCRKRGRPERSLVDNITTITGLSLGGQHHDNHWAVSWWTTSRQSLGCL